MSQRMVRIAGTMTSFGGELYHVWLDATVAELPGTYGVEGAQIVSLDFASDNSSLPDGEYILEYFFEKPYYHRNVQLKSGRLMM